MLGVSSRRCVNTVRTARSSRRCLSERTSGFATAPRLQQHVRTRQGPMLDLLRNRAQLLRRRARAVPEAAEHVKV